MEGRQAVAVPVADDRFAKRSSRNHVQWSAISFRTLISGSNKLFACWRASDNPKQYIVPIHERNGHTKEWNMEHKVRGAIQWIHNPTKLPRLVPTLFGEKTYCWESFPKCALDEEIRCFIRCSYQLMGRLCGRVNSMQFTEPLEQEFPGCSCSFLS